MFVGGQLSGLRNFNNIYYSADEYSQGFLEALGSNIKEDNTDLDLFFGCIFGLGLDTDFTIQIRKRLVVVLFMITTLVICLLL